MTMLDGAHHLSHQVVGEVRQHLPTWFSIKTVSPQKKAAEAPRFGKPSLLGQNGRAAAAYEVLAQDV